MPALTRRRDPEAQQATWLIYFADVHIGTIARSAGNPGAAPQWQRRCGFYPGSRPGECTGGTAPTFEQARADFEAAWQVFSAGRTEPGTDRSIPSSGASSAASSSPMQTRNHASRFEGIPKTKSQGSDEQSIKTLQSGNVP